MIFGLLSRNMNKLYMNRNKKFALVKSMVSGTKHVILRPTFSCQDLKVFRILYSENAISKIMLGGFLERQFHYKVTSVLRPVKLNHFLCLPSIQAFPNIEQRRSRHRSSKKSSKGPEYDSDSDSDEDEDSSQGAKIITVRVQSLRLDGLLKKAFNVARNKIETSFYEGNIRVNGKKPNKKSFQLRIGDEVDLIQGVSPLNPEFLSISRVEVVTVRDDNEDDVDKLLVKIKRFKNLYIENYESDPWKKGSSLE